MIITLLILGLLQIFNLGEKDPVAARFGKHKITLGEFKIAYLDVIKKPNTFDSKKLREDFLDVMIASRLLAENATELKLDENPTLQLRFNSYKEKCLRDAHFEKVIKPLIHMEEKDIEEAYSFTQEERNISHLFFKSEEQADSNYVMLQNGASFDSLAKIIFADSALVNNGGSLGWVQWAEMDYNLGMTAFRLPVGKISAPVKSQFGYHIVKVNDFKKKPLITRQEYIIAREKTKYQLEYKLGDKYAFDYIENMLKQAKVTLNPDVMEIVDNKLAEQFKRKPTQYDQMSEIQLDDSEINKLETSLWDLRNETMATINGKPMTVGEFVGLMNYIPYKAIYNSFKSAFDYSVRDFLLTHESHGLGLDSCAKVKIKFNLYKEYVLQLEMRKMLVRGVEANDSDLKNYYEAHKANYNGATFEEMKETIKPLVLSQKKREIIPDYIKKLIGKMKIEKHIDLIHNYYDNLLNRLN